MATLTGLIPATTYTVQVIAGNNVGVSQPSNVVTITTLKSGMCFMFYTILFMRCLNSSKIVTCKYNIVKWR